MNAPIDLRQGHVLLLSEPDNFSAAYIRRSLEAFGVPVLAPEGPPAEALASIDPAEWLHISSCIAVDLGKAMFDAMAAQQRQIPFVFVGQDPGDWFAGPYTWLCPPFAGFQVIELLADMVAAASRSMQAGLDFATTRA